MVSVEIFVPPVTNLSSHDEVLPLSSSNSHHSYNTNLILVFDLLTESNYAF